MTWTDAQCDRYKRCWAAAYAARLNTLVPLGNITPQQWKDAVNDAIIFANNAAMSGYK